MRRSTYPLSVLSVAILCGMIIPAACRESVPRPRIPLPEEYRSWALTTETVFDYPVPGHLDHFRKIYINAVGQTVRPDAAHEYRYPDGSMFIKEIYAGLTPPKPEEKPISLSVMLKAPQHPNALRGWLWMVKDLPNGEERIIDYKFCVECHANANEPHPYGDRNLKNEQRDYVFFPPSKSVPGEKPY